MTVLDAAPSAAPARRDRLVLPVFAGTLFLSAFLLFSVQPFFARLVLPILGGSPGVWSVAMVFFQGALLAGYAYAHLLASRLSVRTGALVHLGVMALALLALPVAIPAGFGEPPVSGQALWLIGLFTVAIGLPFFAVSANGPLLQAWFARSGHAHAADPYFLYGASNVGSFASLFLYILLIEPVLTVGAQSFAWTSGFVALGLCIGACALLTGRAGVAAAPRLEAAAAIGWRRIARWVAIAAVPSALLVAVTAHISTDIAAAPFLWVAPLALFLLTFVIAFARRPLIGVTSLSNILAPLAALVLAQLAFPPLLGTFGQLVVSLAFLFTAALLAHSLLVADRPAAGQLTAFYLWMSAGGVLGGAFASLLAPVLFDWVAEYPLLVLAALALRPQGEGAERRATFVALAMAGAAAAVLLWPAVSGAVTHGVGGGTVAIAAAGFALAAAVVRLRSEALHALFAALAVVLVFVFQHEGGALARERSFFGVVRALPSPDGRFTIMAHGTTEHGAVLDAERAAGVIPTPTSYYHETGGITASLRAVQARLAGRPARMGVIGLGAGAMLCHRGPGERWVSFEIDAAVVAMAQDERLFPFVPRCGKGDPIVLGDARLTLAREPAASFDWLLIDAFSSDSIPAHLMTVEALRLYADRLAPDGVLTLHISNRYMELGSVVAAIARDLGLTGRIGEFVAPDEAKAGARATDSRVVVLARSEAALGRMTADPRWRALEPGSTAPWTDDYANIPAAIWRGR